MSSVKINKSIKSKRDMNGYEFCINDFNIIEKSPEDDAPTFQIQIFAKNMLGQDASIIIDDYEPFFYIQVPDKWKGAEKNNIFQFFRSKLGNLGQSLLSSSLHQSKTLYGFDNGKKYNFMIVRFNNMIAFNKLKNLWYESAEVEDENGDKIKEYRLKESGFNYNRTNLILYEANIPPLIRYLHIRNISPSGWIKVLDKKMLQTTLEDDKTTHCCYEFMGGQNNVIALPDKEDRAPFIKTSMDIEASSSHGDFPVPVKNYKKLASQMMELFVDLPGTTPLTNELLRSILVAAFETKELGDTNTDSSIPKISVVFPKFPISTEQINTRIDKWLTTKVADYSTDANIAEFKKINTLNKAFEKNNIKFVAKKEQEEEDEEEKKDEEDDEDENEKDTETDGRDEKDANNEEDFTTTNNWSNKHDEKIIRYSKKTKTILSILNDPTFSKDGKVTELLLSLNNSFPLLQGDQVTFIGSTFLRETEKELYLNHCIVLNTCDKLPSPNSEIEVYDTEREVLLAWTRLIRRENPDIIIGYNIFGFDYEFMFRRAIECDCMEEFLQLSKNKEEVCGNLIRDKRCCHDNCSITAEFNLPTEIKALYCSEHKSENMINVKTQEYDIERSSISISTGTYDLAIIKMPGRLQVDMLNYFRRTVNMSSYKLDSVASEIIGDEVIGKNYKNACVQCQTKNMTGLSVDSWIHFILQNHSSKYFDNGKKYRIVQINHDEKWFEIEGMSEDQMSELTAQKIKWGLAKDDVTPKDIFRLTHEGPSARAIVAKYCIQDCNLVHHLFTKLDVLTGLSEMARLCSVPMSYLVFRGQGIKLTSFLAKKCREKGVLMPVIRKGNRNDAYEGAVVLTPKTGIYLEEGVAVGDFASLYPSAMQSENLCISSKVWTKVYDNNGLMIQEVGEKNGDGSFKYDNLSGHKYVNMEFDTYAWLKNPLKPGTKAKKTKTGHKICRFEQTEGILPSILKELLKARKDTRKRIPGEPDQFMKNILDQRQLAYKVTANSIYGQTGAKTSTFYEPDVAASTTAMGRKCLLFAKKIIEECYGEEDSIMTTKEDGDVIIRPSYVYGDTDSVFFKLNARDPITGENVGGEKGIKITIELSQIICHTVSKFLKQPHDFEYEKTFWPFILFSKKKYSGEKYELSHTKHKRNNMGNAAVKRDTAPITRDLLGQVTDIIMEDKNMHAAINAVSQYVTKLLAGEISMDQFVITKSLNSNYKNPKQIAHKVLADRITEREPGNKPTSGDRIPFVYIINPNKVRYNALKGKAKVAAPKVLQGDCIETPSYIKNHFDTCKIDYGHYVIKQLMNPLVQLFALALEDIWKMLKKEKNHRDYNKELKSLSDKITNDLKNKELTQAELDEKIIKKTTKLREKNAAQLIFGKFVTQIKNQAEKNQNITTFFVQKSL